MNNSCIDATCAEYRNLPPLVVCLDRKGALQLGKNFSFWVNPAEGGVLNTTGVYSLCRHPFYTGLVAFSLGLGFSTDSFTRIALACLLGYVLVSGKSTIVPGMPVAELPSGVWMAALVQLSQASAALMSACVLAAAMPCVRMLPTPAYSFGKPDAATIASTISRRQQMPLLVRHVCIAVLFRTAKPRWRRRSWQKYTQHTRHTRKRYPSSCPPCTEQHVASADRGGRAPAERADESGDTAPGS